MKRGKTTGYGMGVIGMNLVGKMSQTPSADEPIVVMENDVCAIFDPWTCRQPVGAGDFERRHGANDSVL